MWQNKREERDGGKGGVGGMVNWRAYTKHILPFNSDSTTQVKTKVRKVPIDEGKGAQAQGCARARNLADSQNFGFFP